VLLESTTKWGLYPLKEYRRLWYKLRYKDRLRNKLINKHPLRDKHTRRYKLSVHDYVSTYDNPRSDKQRPCEASDNGSLPDYLWKYRSHGFGRV